MQNFIADFHFLRPWWLLALILPIVGYFRFFVTLKNVSAWENVCDKKLLEFLLVKGSSRQRSFAAFVLFVGMLGAILALAGPTWQKKEIPSYAPENPIMFLLNLSSDMDKTDVTPNRLMRAKYTVADILKLSGDAQSGLIVYTDEPFLISPLAEDKRIIENLLSAVVSDIMPENGDKLNRAIDYAVTRLQDAGYKNGNIVVLAADVGQDFNFAIMSAAAAYAKGYKVSVIDASAQGAEKLKMIAQKGGGKYTTVLSSVESLAKYLRGDVSDKLKQSENEREIWLDAGYYLVVIPLLCVLYFFRRGILAVALFCYFWTTSAQAGFFLNNNQEAMRAFDKQDYEQAAEKFDIRPWKASAQYRAGNYEEAYKNFSGTDAESLYNQGNALAKGGKIKEAIEKYEQVLKMSPNHDDAKFNLDYLKQQQQNQQQQSEGDKDKNKDKDKEQNQSSNGQNQNKQDQNEQSGSQPEGDNKQSSDGEDKSSSGGQGEEQQQEQQRSQQQSGNEEQNEKDAQSKSQQAPTATEQQQQTQEQAEASVVKNDEKTKEKGENFSEAAQAREQQFRDIPEDVGGLLRSFIYKEYQKNRYKDN